MATRQYWLVKSEPTSYSIEHLRKDGESSWTGVRNYEARNFMRKMKVGDLVLFYHSNGKSAGVYGVARVSRAAHPDETQFDEKGDYFEPRASREKPVWECANIAFKETLKNPVSLGSMRIDPELQDMHILRKGSRLSVTPVTEKQYRRVLALGKG